MRTAVAADSVQPVCTSNSLRPHSQRGLLQCRGAHAHMIVWTKITRCVAFQLSTIACAVRAQPLVSFKTGAAIAAVLLRKSAG